MIAERNNETMNRIYPQIMAMLSIVLVTQNNIVDGLIITAAALALIVSNYVNISAAARATTGPEGPPGPMGFRGAPGDSGVCKCEDKESLDNDKEINKWRK